MDKRLSLAKHRFILKKFTTVPPSQRKQMALSAPPVFFQILRRIAKYAISKGIEVSVARKILSTRSIKSFAASKSVIVLLQKIL